MCSLINYTLATEENVVMYKSAHDAIPFQLLEISSITTPNHKQYGIFVQGTFFKGFLGKILAILWSCIMKKILIWKLSVNGIVLVIGTRVNVYQIS